MADTRKDIHTDTETVVDTRLAFDAQVASVLDLSPSVRYRGSALSAHRIVPNALMAAFAPAWADINQRVDPTIIFSAEFARLLREEKTFVPDANAYDDILSQTVKTPRRRERLRRLIREAITWYPDPERPGLSLVGRVTSMISGEATEIRPTDSIVEMIYRHAYGWGTLEPFMHEDGVTEIMVIDYKTIFTERNTADGARKFREIAKFDSEETYVGFVERLVQRMRGRLDHEEPSVDVSLPDGSRVHITYPPITDVPTITIRRFPEKHMTLDVLEEGGTFSHEIRLFLNEMNASIANVIIYGATGSGKTTLLSALLNARDGDRRIIVIEDTPEIAIDRDFHPNTIKQLSCPTRLMRALVKDALRMRPDHLVIGETRDATAYDLIQALNSGTSGSISTIHAASPSRALERLTNLVREAESAPTEEPARRMVTGAVNLLIQMSSGDDGVRRIGSIDEVLGVDVNAGFRFLFQNIFRTEVDYDGQRSAVRFEMNPRYRMGSSLASMFRSVSKTPSPWNSTKNDNPDVQGEERRMRSPDFSGHDRRSAGRSEINDVDDLSRDRV